MKTQSTKSEHSANAKPGDNMDKAKDVAGTGKGAHNPATGGPSGGGSNSGTGAAATAT